MPYIRSFLLSFALVAILSLPTATHAASVSDLIAQLKTIQAQLLEMRGQVLGVSVDSPLVLPALSDSDAGTTPTVTNTKDTSDVPLILPGYVGPTERAPSIYVDIGDTQASAERDGTFGDYSIEMEITADDGDIYIPITAGTTERSGFDFGVFATVWKGTFSSSVSTMGTKSGNYIVIQEGDTAFVDLEVYLDPDVTGDYGVRLNSVQYAAYAGGPLKSYTFTGAARTRAATDKLYLLGDVGEEERNIVVEPVTAGAEGHAYDASRGNFYVQFDVTATGDDAYIGVTDSLIWGLFGPQNTNVLRSTNVLTSTAPMKSGYFVVGEEETERFTFSVDAIAKKSGSHSLELHGLIHAASAGGKIGVYGLGGGNYKTNQLTLTAGSTTSSVQGAFTTKSLTTKKENPTIKGTASGTKTVGFSIGQGDKVYGSGDIKVKKNGKWKHKVKEDLRAGTYDITLYANNVELAKDTLKVRLSETDVASKMAIVVGIYEGYYPNGRGHRQHTEGTVTLNIEEDSSYPAQPLVLSSYESTNWVINNPNNAKISKIIAIGHYKQRVTGAPAGTPIEYHTVREGDSVPVVTKKDDELKKLELWLLDRGLYYSGVYFGGTNASSIDIEYGYKG